MSLLHMSFSGAVMVVVIVVIRALAIHRLPKKVFMVLWDITVVRLLVPYSLPCSLSVYSLIGRFVPTEAPENSSLAPCAPIVPAAGVPVMPTPSASDVPTLSIHPWMAIWLVGAVACTVFFTVVYLNCRREFQASLPVDSDYVRLWQREHPLLRTIEIRQSDKISAPLTYGVLHPVILMPKTTDWNDRSSLRYVLAHEYVHIRRFDAVTKLALTAALCVHWCNPAVWILYILANRDMELSCDEAVIRRFGESTRSAYALTLIRMEETKSGLTPQCDNFSKNAIEERILAIMKMKKPSLAAQFFAVVLVVGVIAAFATSGQSAAAKGPDKNNPDNPVQTVMDDYTVMSYTDPADGKTYYSWDGGKTWTAMTEKEFNDSSAWNNVEWWTAEEYAAWLEQEKMDLQTIIGAQGWTPSTGWFTWTQEMVDETIAKYEQTLKDIQAGQKISKPTADGDTMIQFGYDPSLQVTTTVIAANAQPGSLAQSAVTGSTTFFEKNTHEPTCEELLAEYGKFGISFNTSGKMMYQGKLVRWFADFVELEEGALATRYVYRNDEGTEYIHTVRDRIDNGDGSYDPFGPLVEIVPWEAGKWDDFGFLFQGNQISEATTVSNRQDVSGTTFEEHFARYKDFGITYVEAQNASGQGNVYLNGQLVSRFSDISPDGSAFSFTSADQGGIAVRTVYGNNGELTGVEPVRK